MAVWHILPSCCRRIQGKRPIEDRYCDAGMITSINMIRLCFYSGRNRNRDDTTDVQYKSSAKTPSSVEKYELYSVRFVIIPQLQNRSHWSHSVTSECGDKQVTLVAIALEVWDY